jgi:hypothetical protein
LEVRGNTEVKKGGSDEAIVSASHYLSVSAANRMSANQTQAEEEVGQVATTRKGS